MTLYEIVKTFCSRTGIPIPPFVVASTDAQIVQIKSLVDEVCEDLCTRFTWEALTFEAAFSTVNVEDQGAVKAIAPKGFLSIIGDTIYNRTLRLPVYGPMSARKWQGLKALPTTGPFYKYRIRGKHILFNPVPTAGHACFFEYRSSHIAVSADGLTTRCYAADDTDTFVLDSKLIQAGLRWVWKKEKGLPYAEEFSRYEELVAIANGQDASKPVLNMGSSERGAMPGIFISPGNWNLP